MYWQVINESPSKRVRPPKGEDYEKGENYFDEKQISNLLNFILDKETLIYQALALVTVYGGLRKGEALGLYWNDVDFENNTIRINKAFCRVNKTEIIKAPKNLSSIRNVVLPSSVVKFLKELKIGSTDVRVFPLPYSAPTHWFSKVVKNYNLANEEKLPECVTFHGLRHTAATLLISQGLDIKTVSARLGHKDATTTLNIYSHAIRSKDQEASNALDRAINLKSNK